MKNIEKTEKYKRRLATILEPASGLKEILFSEGPVEHKRQLIRTFLSNLLEFTFSDNPSIASLEWVLTRESVYLWRSLLSKRNETLSGHSVLRYLNDIIHHSEKEDFVEPSPGFFAELECMVNGLIGKSGIYIKSAPAFLKYEGKRAAQLRSQDLSRLARHAKRFMERYPCGLDNETIRMRSRNKQRILKFFDATELEWERWKWHTSHIIRDVDTLSQLVDLTEDEFKAVKLARENRIPFGITPYYLSLMDKETGGRKDSAIRAQVLPSLKYVTKLREQIDCSEASMDFMLEKDTSPIEGVTRRYPNIVILKPILTCPQICVYCQRNWEIEDVYSTSAVLSDSQLGKAIQWIEKNPEINEVLITGGDPLLLSNKKLENLLSQLSRNQNIIRIRIGTRTPVTLPQRITDSLARTINRYHNPGKREVVIITHFEHPYEITPQAMEAVQKFKRYGMGVYNQLVYTYYVSKRYEAALLRQKLRLIGVTPYYTFNTKGKEETSDYRVPIARLLQEQKEEARLLPGTVRTDVIVFNVPGLGKNYLDASQHHDLISILPDGCRMYEFHPWEKKLSLVDTYVYKDVSIYDYIKRLKKDGEDVSDYNSIWYYY